MSNIEEKISILVATFNEQENIRKTIESLRTAFPKAEIVVVDDGSGDRTVAEARHLESNLVKVIALTHKGKGNAIKKAVEIARGEIMVQVDADLQFPIEGIPSLIGPIMESRADIVLGSRYLNPDTIEKGSVSFVKCIASYIIARIISIICGQRYTDIFAGFKAWRAEVIKDIDIREDGFAYEAEISIKAKRRGYVILEVPTSYRRRIIGESKIRFLYNAFEIPWRVIHLVLFAR